MKNSSDLFLSVRFSWHAHANHIVMAPLNTPHRKTIFGGGREGYTTYPIPEAAQCGHAVGPT